MKTQKEIFQTWLDGEILKGMTLISYTFNEEMGRVVCYDKLKQHNVNVERFCARNNISEEELFGEINQLEQDISRQKSEPLGDI